MVSFEVGGEQNTGGNQRQAFKVADALSIFLISNNLGDAKSIVSHPATTTHQRLSAEVLADLNISGGLLRLSVGLESADDLIADLNYGLEQI